MTYELPRANLLGCDVTIVVLPIQRVGLSAQVLVESIFTKESGLIVGTVPVENFCLKLFPVVESVFNELVL